MKSTLIARFTLGLCLIGATGCSPDLTDKIAKTDSNPPVNRKVLPGVFPSDDTKNRLLEAKSDLFKQLSGRLMAALNTGGSAEAIDVCFSDAPKIASEVGRMHNVNIGRTGVRLRNSSNLPPDWAQPMVSANMETPFYAMLNDDKAVALLPIRLQPQCLMCHGPVEQISDDVKRVLRKRYPSDQATGFQDGELRGWFWVEER